jgi:molybdopterin biosynthesis enzyme
MRRKVSLEEAQQLLLERTHPTGECGVALLEASGRVLSHRTSNRTGYNPYCRTIL